MSATSLIALLLLALVPVAAGAHSQHEIQQSIGFEQRIGERLPRALRFRDASGKTVSLGEILAGGRPVVLELAWYSCSNLCPITLRNLAHALGEVAFAPGRDYEVVTVSIDPGDGVAEAKKMRGTMLAAYGSEKTNGWHVLTGAKPAIERLAQAVGFRFAYDEEQQQYAHPAGVVLVAGDGRISRYLFGLEYPARDLRLGLIDAGKGELGSVIDQLVLRCHSFDPATGRYSLAVMNVVRIAGGATVLALGGVLAFWLRRERRARRGGGA